MSSIGLNRREFVDTKIREAFGKRGRDITVDEMFADLVSDGRKRSVH
jgi:hypothetical protein